jgi:hypothetical protein
MFLRNVLLENNFHFQQHNDGWIVKFSIHVTEDIKERSYFLRSVMFLVSWLLDSDCHKNAHISIGYMKKFIVLYHVTVKWQIELFRNGPVIFQCVPLFMSHLYDKSQKYISPAQSLNCSIKILQHITLSTITKSNDIVKWVGSQTVRQMIRGYCSLVGPLAVSKQNLGGQEPLHLL